ncbi:CHAD domain-containing protein [Nocardia bovistercoris]|uniref:CHAD domain-containing protein n=1 Tax=Nocardia bovistercoris TaxID=2785916 RepID=A0A931IE33_9NOCA|nr:CHAD domain-containing protein [Nocardia bovistercoris]MBH0779982.1 CHAD domain-containing protein [Nocardia bovistercoris]
MGVTAGKALNTALGDDVDRLLAAEPDVRADAYDSVHQMRVATRRLRSVLRSYRSLLRKEPVALMNDELKWLADLLGVARDAEVRAERFTALLADKTAASDPADVAKATERLVTAERARYTTAHAEILTALDDARYHTLRDRLVQWRGAPPLRGARAAVPAPDFFGVVMNRDRERVEAMVRYEPTVSAQERVELLHDIRKSAKRLRYSCEAAEPVLGEDATAMGSRAKRLQTVLGDHRDAVESREAILERAAEAEADGESRKIYDRLAKAELKAAERELERYPAAAEAVSSAGR